MKILNLLASSFFVAHADDLTEKFLNYLAKYGKNYPTTEEFVFRRSWFERNHNFIQ